MHRLQAKRNKNETLGDTKTPAGNHASRGNHIKL